MTSAYADNSCTIASEADIINIHVLYGQRVQQSQGCQSKDQKKLCMREYILRFVKYVNIDNVRVEGWL